MARKFEVITRAAIRALPAGKSLREHGIQADKLADGDIRYSINIMVDGQRIHRVIGRDSEGVTREQAERAIETHRTQAREGRLNLPTGRKTHRSFKEAAKQYLERMEETEGKNLGPKRRHLTTNLLRHFGQHRLDMITEFMVRQYQSKRSAEGAASGTINRELATLRHLLNSAARWRWMSKDSVPNFTMASEQQQMAILTEDEAAALMQAAIEDQDERCWLFVAFGLGAAMRHREILRVRYEQIDFINRRIFIPDAKAGEREQPITETLMTALQQQMEKEQAADKSGWVFPTAIPKQSANGCRTNMARQFARCVIRAGLNPANITPHTMRRTAITRLVKAGVDLPTIQRISGHKTLAMVLRYVHVHGSHIDKAISNLDSPIPGITTPKLHTEKMAA